MHDEPRQQLCQLIAQYGRSLSEDPRRCGALLKDHCGQYKREIFVLVTALENRVATELINASVGVPESILLSRLIKRLEDELGLAETAAKWAVETWALALGVINQPLSVSVSAPVQPVSPVSQGSSTSAIVASPASSTGGKLLFPKFSVGKVKIGGKEQIAVGEIDVPQSQIVEFKVSEDVTDFSFIENCDPDSVIRILSLSRCVEFRDQALVYLKNFNNLLNLDLSFCGLYDVRFNDGWKTIESLKNLTSLNLSGCSIIKDNTLHVVSTLYKLESLNLNGAGRITISDTGLVRFEYLINLKELDLRNHKNITGIGVIQHLGNMTNLKLLNLSECENVSPARLQELKQMLPNTRILP